MIIIIRRTALSIMNWLRKSRWRRLIICWLVWLHNTSYHLISFFAKKNGLHPKHAILNYHQFFTDNISSSDSVLDVGSGNGAVANDVAAQAKSVVGIDIRPANISIAKKKYQRPNLKFILGDATSQRFDQTFDVIILSNVLEHIEHRPQFLTKLGAVAPKFLIRVPLLTRDWVTVFKKNEGLEYRLDDTHYIEYSVELFKKEIAAAGLSISYLHTAFGELYAIAEAGE